MRQALLVLLPFLLFPFSASFSQDAIRVEPPHWWAGMNNSNLQLLVQADGVGECRPEIAYEGVSIKKVTTADSPDYLFVDIELGESARPGRFLIAFVRKGRTLHSYTYELKSRKQKAEDYRGFDARDVIYLITPDRFANANTSNDSFENLKQQGTDRKDDYARHGGDIAGITASLDYLSEMGFTAIWPSPLLENNMPRQSYHGYAITDMYKVDPRFGTMEEYVNLAEELRSRRMGLIMDVVSNHCGSGHWWMEDLPFKDWLNYQDDMQTTNHRRTVNQDPYASSVDKEKMNGGWFVPSMPDLNQRNPFMSEYLIQNSIWWIETLGLTGIRQDTWPYPDKQFLADWSCRIMTEYPNFSIVGEEWSYNPLLVAYWQQGHVNPDGYQTCLKSTMDFPNQKNLNDAFNQPERWDQGLIRLYEGLANDFAYTAPNDLLIFGDNHDMDRIHTQLNNDVEYTKMAMTWLLTSRGIPQVYYGTEILMENSAKRGDHGLIRTDFPGGWEGDSVNAFTGQGLNEAQLEMQEYMRKLLTFRKGNLAITSGKTIHFAPEKAVYVYGRCTESDTVLVVMNKHEVPQELDMSRFTEIAPEGTEADNAITGEAINITSKMTFPPKTATILQW